MAKIKGPLFSQKASGSVANFLTFSDRKTGQQARFQRKQRYQRTPAQRVGRDIYRAAIADWRSLTDYEREEYNKKAVGKVVSGWNLFLKDYYMSLRVLSRTTIHLSNEVEYKELFVCPVGYKFFVVGCLLSNYSLNSGEGDDTLTLVNTSVDNRIVDCGEVTIPRGLGLELKGSFFTPLLFETGFISSGASLGLRNTIVGEIDDYSVDVDVLGYLVAD